MPDAGSDSREAAADVKAGLAWSFDDCAADASLPKGWRTNAKDAVACDRQIGHTRAGSLRAQKLDGAAAVQLGTDFAIGKLPSRRVRLLGWLRRDVAAPSGGAALWLRAQGPFGETIALDNMSERPLAASAGEWTQVYAEIDVPAEAVGLVGGLHLHGSGAVWLDDLELLDEAIPEPRIVMLTGSVRTKSGVAVSDAWVAISSGGRIVKAARSDSSGNFSAELPTGEYDITAQHPALGAAFRRHVPIGSEAPVDIELDAGIPAKASSDTPITSLVIFRILRGQEELLFIGEPGALQLPSGDRVEARAESNQSILYSPFRPIDTKLSVAVLTSMNVATPEVAEAVARAAHAWSLEGPSASAIRVMDSFTINSEVVGLGEPSHGAHEAFLLRLEWLKYLVRERGFSVIAMELGYQEAELLNRFILSGEGDVRSATERLGSWTYRTNEMLAVVSWLRDWNHSAPLDRRVTVTGVDVQSAAGLGDALSSAAQMNGITALLPPLETIKAVLGAERWWLDKGKQRDLLVGIEEVRKEVARAKKKLGSNALRQFEFLLRRIEQYFQLMSATVDAPTLREADSTRDLLMAENVLWARGAGRTRKKVIFWAHNAHVGMLSPYRVPTGHHLKKKLGKRYTSLGMLFGGGAFQAIDVRPGVKNGWLREFTLSKASVHDVVAPFIMTGMQVAFIDLGALKGDARKWFGEPHLVRQTGAPFVDEETMTHAAIATSTFDGLMFINEITRATPLARAAPK